MQLTKHLVESLDLSGAVELVTSKTLQRFPPLVVYSCLEDAKSSLVQYAAASVQAGRAAVTETITIPRKGFGPRPAQILSPVDLSLYNALIIKLSDSLPESSRSSSKFFEHEQFGVPDSNGQGGAPYLVEIDVAAYYEYIMHEHLRSELLLLSDSIETISGVVSLLGAITEEAKGIPQLIDASDRLGDVYIGPIERALQRRGWSLSRVADDFKVECSDWATALEIVDEAALAARRIGLVLSTEKTTVRKRETIKATRDTESKFITDRFEAAADQIRANRFLFGAYADGEPEEVDANEQVQEAFHSLLKEWQMAPDDKPLHAKWLSSAMFSLLNDDERIEDVIHREIVFRFPLQLEFVCRYVLHRRHEQLENWRTLARLVQIKRQSPWASTWMLYVMACLTKGVGGADETLVVAWASGQLKHWSELVRAQAAWCLAMRNDAALSDIVHLYGNATILTRPALAASVGKIVGASSNRSEVKAIRSDSKLSRAALEWGGAVGA